MVGINHNRYLSKKANARGREMMVAVLAGHPVTFHGHWRVFFVIYTKFAPSFVFITKSLKLVATKNNVSFPGNELF